MANGRMTRWLVGLLVGLMTVTLAGVAGANGPQNPGSASAAQRVIVSFDPAATSSGGQESILRNAGATRIKALPGIAAMVAMADARSVSALRNARGVLRVEVDALATTMAKGNGKPGPAPPPAQSLPWGVDRIDADLTWGAQTGAGVKVAVIDTGIDLDHPDLAANIKGGYNAINAAKSADDDNGHGTHVAGTIAAVNDSQGVVGVAPSAHLYAVKVLSKNGSGWISDIIEGIQWSIDNGMQVINMSLGSSSSVQAFHDAVKAAHDAGIVIVAAAGNSGPGDNTVSYPAAYPETIAVSATDSSDVIASFSSRGPEVEIAAPGVSINSTYRGGGYKVLSGTSMASPHVAGAAALVLGAGVSDANGDGRVNDDVRTRLTATADDLGAAGNDSLYGTGLVDAQEAATGVQTLP